MYFGASYSFAKLGKCYNIRQNFRLRKKLKAYERITQVRSAQLADLVAFEDNARLKFGLEAISPDVRQAGVGGRPGAEEMAVNALGDPSVIRADSLKELIATLLRQVKIEDSTFNRVSEVALRQNAAWSQTPSISPATGPITSPFGYRIHPITGYYVTHNGIDISGRQGTPVRAPADGIVSSVVYRDDFGRMVVINHPASGFKTVFAHLFKAAVYEGQAVKRGDLIGYIGTTGRSTGPHLHFEVHKNNVLVNPVDYIIPVDVVVD
jgi:murein DD-endopeptidase MepM/ murein hydrolase activator NlpD